MTTTSGQSVRLLEQLKQRRWGPAPHAALPDQLPVDEVAEVFAADGAGNVDRVRALDLEHTLWRLRGEERIAFVDTGLLKAPPAALPLFTVFTFDASGFFRAPGDPKHLQTRRSTPVATHKPPTKVKVWAVTSADLLTRRQMLEDSNVWRPSSPWPDLMLGPTQSTIISTPHNESCTESTHTSRPVAGPDVLRRQSALQLLYQQLVPLGYSKSRIMWLVDHPKTTPGMAEARPSHGNVDVGLALRVILTFPPTNPTEVTRRARAEALNDLGLAHAQASSKESRPLLRSVNSK